MVIQMAKKKLTKEDMQRFKHYLQKATNPQLYKMQKELKKEIRLSETAIREGFEKRKLKKLA